jgi:protein TonB
MEPKTQGAPAPGRNGDPHAPLFGTLLASRPEREAGRTARSLLGAVAAHGVLILVLAWVTMAVGQEVVAEEQVTIIELPAEAPPPPPPPPPPDIAAPETPPLDVAKGFQTLSMPDLVPPDIPPPQMGVRINELDFSGQGTAGGRADGREGAPPDADLAAAPVFTPMTIRPELLNAPEVMRALTRAYPPLLRDAGVGGTTVMWFFIDETGTVVRTQLSKSSGFSALDEAADRVADVMKFSPAMNRDRRVQVWVEIPIVFTSR